MPTVKHWVKVVVTDKTIYNTFSNKRFLSIHLSKKNRGNFLFNICTDSYPAQAREGT